MKIFKLAIVFIIILSVAAIAQPTGGGPGGGGDPNVPLGGIEILITAGALFGAKKWLDRNKKN
jgi:hypothetical protein